MNRKAISLELVSKLQEFIDYDPHTGVLVWRKNKGPRACLGKECGYLHRTGYRHLLFDGKKMFAHRVAWVIFYGGEPKNGIDHINQNKKDNRINNLREATFSENSRNRKRQSNNKSGFTGVWWSKIHSKWVAEVCGENRKKHIKHFKNACDAADWAKNKRMEIHQSFATDHQRQ